MFKSILVPVDVEASEDAAKIILAAAKLNADWGGALHVAAIAPDMGMSIVGSYFEDGFEQKSVERAGALLETLLAQTGAEAVAHVRCGKIYDEIIALAGQISADLIIVGAKNPELKDYLLGSNAARIVRHSDRSVLVLRGES